MDSQQVNGALSLHVIAPSGLHQLLGCLSPEIPALKLSMWISSGCVLCDLHSSTLQWLPKRWQCWVLQASLGWFGEAGASL